MFSIIRVPLLLLFIGTIFAHHLDAASYKDDCFKLLEIRKSAYESAVGDSARSIALVRLLDAFRTTESFTEGSYNELIERSYRREAMQLAKKAGCWSCQGYAHLISAYGVPPDEPFNDRLRHFDSALINFRFVQDSAGILTAKVFKANILMHLKQVDSALFLLENIEQQFNSKHNAIRIKYFHLLAHQLWGIGKYRKAGKAWASAIESIPGQEMTGNFVQIVPGFSYYHPSLSAELTGNLGLTQRRTGNLSKALSNFEEANELYKSFGSVEGQVWMLQMISQVHYDQGNYEKAFEATIGSLNLVEMSNSQLGVRETFSYCNSLKFGLEFFLKVGRGRAFVERANKAIILCNAGVTKDSLLLEQLGHVHVWKSLIYQYMGLKDSAMASSIKALDYFNAVPKYYLTIGSKREEVKGSKALALFILSWAKSKDKPESNERDQAMALAQKINGTFSHRNLMRLADCLANINEFEEALRFYTIIQNDIESTDYVLLKREIFGKKAAVYEQMNAMAQAFRELSLYIAYSDSVVNLSYVSALADADARYRNEIGLRENAELELDNSRLQSDAFRRGAVAAIFIGLFMLLSLSFFWYYKIRKKNAALMGTKLDNEKLRNQRILAEKLQHEEQLKRAEIEHTLSVKEKERLSAARQLAAERAERLNFELEQKEKELGGYAVQQLKHQQELEELKERIKKDLNNEDTSAIIDKHFRTVERASSWKEFQLRMESVHPTFNKQLARLHANLTANEKKLCGLIRMNLTIKQIAKLLNNSPDSVNKARYRLRKKLGLSHEQSLFAYLESLTVEKTAQKN